jgi:hypothetical protein
MSQPLTALRRSVKLLHQIAEDLPPDKIRTQAYPTEWTIADTFSHLGSGAVILRHQFEGALAGTESDPDFKQSVERVARHRGPGERGHRRRSCVPEEPPRCRQ